MAVVGAVALAAFGAGLGGAGAASQKPPKEVPAFYLTARSTDDLNRQAEAIGRKFAADQGPGHSVLVLDFGAARKKGDDYGAALRGGTFFSNDDIGNALNAAAKGLKEASKRGSTTIVYVNSNADLGDPEEDEDYTPFTEDIAKEAGEDQAKTAASVEAYAHQSMGIGGDIEPGLQGTAEPDVPIAMVEAAVEAGDGLPYYDVGTAPCGDTECFGKWTVKDLCSVTSGQGRHPLPEVYFSYQATDWGHVAKGCGIKEWAGASSSSLGDLSPAQSWKELGKRTSASVGPLLVKFP